jgi:diguanylate cyclase (GGDEF)-like protein
MSALSRRTPRAATVAGLPVGRLTVLAAALLTPSAVGLWRALSSSAVLPSAAGALITLVVCWRLWRLVTERERARDELGRRADQQAAVARLGQAALEGIALDDLLDAAVEAAGWLLDLREGCAVYQPADRELGGVPAAVEQALGSGELVRTDDVTAVPVSSPAHTLAVLAVRPGAGGLDGEDLHFLQAVAAVLAGAMEHRRAEQAAQHSALHDPLTGLPNRVLLMDRLARQAASGLGGAVLFVDLDRFKEVNDTFGHDVGDQLLVEVAHRMTTLLRPEDTLARLAGDEFVVLCDGVVSEQVAVDLGGRIRDALSQPFPLPAGVAQVSASVGVVLVAAEADAERLLRDADMAMYQAKRAGRDQVAALTPPG